MREIKFKAKREDNGEWVYGDYHRMVIGGNVKHYIKELDCKRIEICRKTLCQYTGLKDKNGKEIYEGDILSDYTEADGEIIQSKLQVFWNNEFSCWDIDYSFNQNKSKRLILSVGLKFYNYEITGNIHDL